MKPALQTILIILLALAICFVSCKKESPVAKDNDKLCMCQHTKDSISWKR